MSATTYTPALRNRRGMALIYLSAALVVIVMFTSLSVDLAKVQLAKSELRRTADAAALYAAAGLSTSITQAYNNAVSAAAENSANGFAVTLTSADVEYGSWNPDTNTFTVLSGSARSAATAMRITCRRTAARGTAVATTFASILGMRQVDVSASAVATRGQIISAQVDADSCPWLAGATNGTTVAATGGNPTAAKAPAQSPCQITGLPLTAGTYLSFQKASGQTSYADAADYGPDGNTGWIVRQDAVNGINSTSAPLNSFVGIFIDDRNPNSWAQAAEPDFSTDASRNFSSLSPALKQVFFIGDGLDNSGNIQKFKIPSGATRLYLGIMDEKGWWWDNTGYIQTTIMNTKVQLVQ